MHHLKTLVLLLALAGSLTLGACGGQSTSVRCFGPRPVSSVHSVGSSVSFAMTTIQGTFTYSMPKAAFGGAPATMKNGDFISFCADTGDAGGHSTTTITEFSDQGQPAATGTPQSR
jgi:hypothetical protein